MAPNDGRFLIPQTCDTMHIAFGKKEGLQRRDSLRTLTVRWAQLDGKVLIEDG